jgi:ketosteroid isomerase-like protein
MAQENVDVAKTAIDAFNATDVEAFAALTTPDFEWSPSMVAIEGTIFQGREGIETYFQRLEIAWERFHVHRHRFRVGDDLVVMLGRLEGRGSGSGVPVDSSLGMVFDFRGGLISRIRGFLDHTEALKAAGLSQEPTSTANVRVVSEAIAAWNGYALERWLACWDHDCVWVPTLRLQVEGRHAYRGHAGLRNYWQEEEAVWANVRVDVEDVREVGDEVIVISTVAARGKQSDVETNTRFKFRFVLQDEKIVRGESYLVRSS